ncbi:hypothetical protein QZJ86_12090 [Methylomonas montana]|uniref:Bbp16 family capsid cement protein n=1 Tax=Methylomonas montana TaxID=3058963 RepID=UPI00265A7859|nr:hypothetical protein [Methylomonas montana]WKJ88762.1 hypothetical protein QZJ86_12090 [Methylomonas montana]
MQDAKLLLSGAISGVNNAITGQTVTGTGATVYSTYSIDKLAAQDIGEGNPLYLKLAVQTAASGGTSLQVEPIDSTVADVGAGTVTSLGSLTIPVASLVAGAVFYIPIDPAIGSIGGRYLGVRYTTVGAVAAGAYIAEITNQISDPTKFYPSGFSVK